MLGMVPFGPVRFGPAAADLTLRQLGLLPLPAAIGPAWPRHDDRQDSPRAGSSSGRGSDRIRFDRIRSGSHPIRSDRR